MNPKVIEDIAQKLVELRLEMHFDEVEVTAERTGKGLGLVFMSRLPVRQYQHPLHHAYYTTCRDEQTVQSASFKPTGL